VVTSAFLLGAGVKV